MGFSSSEAALELTLACITRDTHTHTPPHININSHEYLCFAAKRFFIFIHEAVAHIPFYVITFHRIISGDNDVMNIQTITKIVICFRSINRFSEIYGEVKGTDNRSLWTRAPAREARRGGIKGLFGGNYFGFIALNLGSD